MIPKLVLFSLATFCCSLACGQTSPTKLAFEVVSIKPRPSDSYMSALRSGRSPLRIDDAQAVFEAFSLKDLIAYAYHLPSDRISGPNWLSDARFDVVAKLPAGATKKQVPEMLQTMLAERFKLAVHHDQKVLPVYNLVIGKPPLKLKESVKDDSDPIACNGGALGQHTCHKVSMAQLADQLTLLARSVAQWPPESAPWAIDRPVIDRTGLQGVYDFTLDYGPDVGGSHGGRGGRSGAAEPPDPSMQMSVIDGIKQLGLKLEPGQHAFDIVVIDHVERVPTDN